MIIAGLTVGVAGQRSERIARTLDAARQVVFQREEVWNADVAQCAGNTGATRAQAGDPVTRSRRADGVTLAPSARGEVVRRLREEIRRTLVARLANGVFKARAKPVRLVAELSSSRVACAGTARREIPWCLLEEVQRTLVA